MAGEGFDVNITSNEINVTQDGSLQSGQSRGVSGVVAILMALYIAVRVVLPGRHEDPSPWYHLTHDPKGSPDFVFFLAFILFLSVLSAYLILIGVRLFFPAGEQLQCDRTTFTYSKIPWVSLGGRWKKRSFPVTDVSELMYGVIIPGDADKNTEDQYGLSFYVGDKEYKIFAGLEADDADDIVKKLRVFGVDVIINQDMAAMVDKKLHQHDPIFSDIQAE